MIRNEIVFHKPIYTTTLIGYSLLRHNGGIAKNEFKIYSSDEFEPIGQRVVANAGYDLKKLNEAQIDEIFKKTAILTIRHYPWRYLKLCALRIVWLWYKENGDEPLYLYEDIIICLFMFPGLILVSVRPHALRAFAFHIFYFILIHATINVQYRFICPMMPYGIMIAVYTALLMFNKTRAILSLQ